ncbi:MAG: IS3 family transposase, partial [Candidatus Firestonebacteria bacterium]
MLGKREEKYEFVKKYGREYGVTRICRELEIGDSGYYAWLKRPKSCRAKENEKLLFKIRVVFAKHKKRYGSPRIFEELDKQYGENRIARLMRKNGIRAKQARKYKATTNSKHDYPIAVNILQQRFVVVRPNEVWVADITYVWTHEGWLYVAVVIDLYARKVVGLAMSANIDAELANAALNQAVVRRRPPTGVLYHADQGSTYAADSHQEIVAKHGLVMSMSEKGNPYDNAPAESFYGTFKKELIFDEVLRTRSEAKGKIFEYVEAYYNTGRRHSYNGYKTPEQAEKAYYQLNK